MEWINSTNANAVSLSGIIGKTAWADFIGAPPLYLLGRGGWPLLLPRPLPSFVGGGKLKDISKRLRNAGRQGVEGLTVLGAGARQDGSRMFR